MRAISLWQRVGKRSSHATGIGRRSWPVIAGVLNFFSRVFRRGKKNEEDFFHGGPLESERFGGFTYWTDSFSQAYDYAGKPGPDFELWAVLIDADKEIFAYEDDEGWFDLEGDAVWDAQTDQIVSVLREGATVFRSEDGWALDHRNRHVRRLPEEFCHATMRWAHA